MGKGNQGNNKTAIDTSEVKNESTQQDLGGAQGEAGAAGDAANAGGDTGGDAVQTSTSTGVSEGTDSTGASGAGAPEGDAAKGADGAASEDQAKDPALDPAAPPAPAPAVPAATPTPAPTPVPADVKLEEALKETFTPTPAPAPAAASVQDFAAQVSANIAKEAAAVGVTVQQTADEATETEFFIGHGLSNSSVSWMRRLAEYIDQMNPKRPMDFTTGVPHQKTLYRTLAWVINSSPDDDFIKLMAMTLEQFNKHADGVFHETAVNRFPEHLTLTAEERSAFFQILNLMNIGADLKGREQRLKQLDFNRMFTNIGLEQISEQGRQRILGFFGK